MKLNNSAFTEKEIVSILELYEEGFSPQEIAELTQLSFQEVLYILNKKIENLPAEELVSFATISDEKILIISDTHIGSKYENFEYINEAYNYALNNGIRTVIHGGDLIQSTIDNVQSQYVNQTKQIEHVVEDYPVHDGFRNYILLGNHDFQTFKKDSSYLQLLERRKDFHIMGFKRAYLTWLGDLISVYHTTKKYHISMPAAYNILSLRGHSHKLSYNKENCIHIPTLSDDLIMNRDARPGFLVGTKKEDYLTVESLYFTESLHSEGKILTKKLK